MISEKELKIFCLARKGMWGVTAKDNRLFVEGVLYRYRAGIPWRDIKEYLILLTFCQFCIKIFERSKQHDNMLYKSIIFLTLCAVSADATEPNPSPSQNPLEEMVKVETALQEEDMPLDNVPESSEVSNTPLVEDKALEFEPLFESRNFLKLWAVSAVNATKPDPSRSQNPLEEMVKVETALQEEGIPLDNVPESSEVSNTPLVEDIVKEEPLEDRFETMHPLLKHKKNKSLKEMKARRESIQKDLEELSTFSEREKKKFLMDKYGSGENGLHESTLRKFFKDFKSRKLVDHTITAERLNTIWEELLEFVNKKPTPEALRTKIEQDYRDELCQENILSLMKRAREHNKERDAALGIKDVSDPSSLRKIFVEFINKNDELSDAELRTKLLETYGKQYGEKRVKAYLSKLGVRCRSTLERSSEPCLLKKMKQYMDMKKSHYLSSEEMITELEREYAPIYNKQAVRSYFTVLNLLPNTSLFEQMKAYRDKKKDEGLSSAKIRANLEEIYKSLCNPWTLQRYFTKLKLTKPRNSKALPEFKPEDVNIEANPSQHYSKEESDLEEHSSHN